AVDLLRRTRSNEADVVLAAERLDQTPAARDVGGVLTVRPDDPHVQRRLPQGKVASLDEGDDVLDGDDAAHEADAQRARARRQVHAAAAVRVVWIGQRDRDGGEPHTVRHDLDLV